MKNLPNIMKRYIPYSISLILASSLLACSDDMDVQEGILNVAEDSVNIILNITEPEVVNTRGELDVNSVTIFIFDATSGNFYQKKDFTNISSGTTVTIPLNSSAKNSSLKLYAVANLPSGVTLPLSPTSADNVHEVVLTQSQESGSLVMNGESSTVTAGTKATINLTRVVAKMTINTNQVDGYTILGYQLRNIAPQGYVGATDNESSAYAFNTGGTKYTVSGTSSDYTTSSYFYPSKGETSGVTDGAYLIIAAQKDDQMNYYRVALKAENSSKVVENINLLANHHYEVEVTSITGDGYETADIAAKHPENVSATVKIHDHVADVYSMVTDGTRELGTAETLNMVQGVNCYMVIKRYSPTDSEYDSELDINIVEGSNWLTYTEVTGDSTEGTITSSGDQDGILTPGNQRKFKLSVKSTASVYNDKEATIEVTWMGLKRTVQVYYNADFNVASICTAQLSIKKYSNSSGTSSTTTNITNYWTFVNGTNSSAVLYGTTLESGTSRVTAMADGKVRNEGLHFPMPYGDYISTYPWEYEYVLNFSALSTNGHTIASVTPIIDRTSDSFIRNYVEWYRNTGDATTTVRFRMKDGGKKLYTYAVGSATFTIKYQEADVDDTEITFDLYHTGFFDYQSNTSYVTDAGYYYYEVITVNGISWLDRNVGAKSNKPYASYSTSTDGGEPLAAGNYYQIGTQGTSSSNYKVVVSDDACPLGYRVPTTTEWNALRLSPQFTSGYFDDTNVTRMLVSYYDTNDETIGNLYFPKARYNNGGSGNYETSPNSGNDAAGYYWTRTTANGLEKDEIGKWLKVLNLSGSSNTYNMGDVSTHRMSLRCVGKNVTATESSNSIEFNVKGATHVYLYSVDDNGNKSGVFSFPGKAIGSQSAVDNLTYNTTTTGDGSYLHFSYNSTVPADKLYVIFCYVTDSGKITILSNQGDDQVTTDVDYEDAIGWDVKNNYNYFFYPSSGSTDHSNPNPASTRIFEVGNTSGGNPGTYAFTYGKTLTVKWTKMISNIDMYRIYVWFPKGNNPLGGFPGGYNQNGSQWIDDVEYYQNTFTIHENANSFQVIFSDGSSTNQTNDITVNSSNFNYTKDGNGNVTVTISGVSKR